LAGGAVFGAKMTALCPTAAAIPARAAPALPVEAVTIVSALISRARATTMALALSLNEAVGFLPSSFTHSRCKPSFAANRSVLNIGVHPAACMGVFSPPGSGTGSNGA